MFSKLQLNVIMGAILATLFSMLVLLVAAPPVAAGWTDESWLVEGTERGPAPASVTGTERTGVAAIIQIAAEEVCVDDQDLMAWMRSPPDAVPSAVIFMMLKSEHAEMFLQLTQGSFLATEPRVLYLYHAPGNPNQDVRALAAVAVADNAGCLINMKGERIKALAGGFVGLDMRVAQICTVLHNVGAPHWSRCNYPANINPLIQPWPRPWQREA